MLIKKLDSKKQMLKAKKADIKEKVYDYASLELELKSGQDTISRVDRVMPHFADRVCTRYTSLMVRRCRSIGIALMIFLGTLNFLRSTWEAPVFV